MLGIDLKPFETGHLTRKPFTPAGILSSGDPGGDAGWCRVVGVGKRSPIGFRCLHYLSISSLAKVKACIILY